MSFDLCSTKIADRPFHIGSIGTRIYSLEELCFFLYHNLCLIDDNVASAALVEWVREDLGLKNLAKKLSDALERPDKDVSYFVLPVFQEAGYLPVGESRRVREELTRVQVQPQEQRLKTRADYLLKGGRLQAAALIYRDILENRSEGMLEQSRLRPGQAVLLPGSGGRVPERVEVVSDERADAQVCQHASAVYVR